MNVWAQEVRGREGSRCSASDSSADTRQLQMLSEMSEAVNASATKRSLCFSSVLSCVSWCFLCASCGTTVNLFKSLKREKQSQKQEHTIKYLSTITVQRNRAATRRYKLLILLCLQLLWEICIPFGCPCILAQACCSLEVLWRLSLPQFPQFPIPVL